MSKLEVVDLVKEFPTRGEPLRILRGISFAIQSGQNLAVVGPSGSGKSTLLHLLGALDRPTEGDVTLDGVSPFALNEAAQARFRNEQIGFVFQEHHLLPQLSVMENVLVPSLACGSVSEADVARAADLVEGVGLGDRKEHRPGELSGGERQRVAVARALLRKPLLILADEPTGSLDRVNADSIGELLLELNDREQTILVVVTHSLELADRFHRTVALNGGLLEEKGVARPASSPVPAAQGDSA